MEQQEDTVVSDMLGPVLYDGGIHQFLDWLRSQRMKVMDQEGTYNEVELVPAKAGDCTGSGYINRRNVMSVWTGVVQGSGIVWTMEELKVGGTKVTAKVLTRDRQYSDRFGNVRERTDKSIQVASEGIKRVRLRTRRQRLKDLALQAIEYIAVSEGGMDEQEAALVYSFSHLAREPDCIEQHTEWLNELLDFYREHEISDVISKRLRKDNGTGR